MNRAMYILLIPTLVVAAGYVVVLHAMGITPNYPLLIGAILLFFASVYWTSRRAAKKGKDEPGEHPAQPS